MEDWRNEERDSRLPTVRTSTSSGDDRPPSAVVPTVDATVKIGDKAAVAGSWMDGWMDGWRFVVPKIEWLRID